MRGREAVYIFSVSDFLNDTPIESDFCQMLFTFCCQICLN